MADHAPDMLDMLKYITFQRARLSAFQVIPEQEPATIRQRRYRATGRRCGRAVLLMAKPVTLRPVVA
jgi:hypothetical protein